MAYVAGSTLTRPRLTSKDRLDRQERQIGGLGHRGDDGVGLDRELGSGDRHRGAPAGRVGLAEPVADEPDRGHVAVLAEDLDRARQELHVDALALGLAELLLVDDELRAGPPVGDRDVLGAVAQAGPRTVHRGVAAADHDHVATWVDLLAEVRLLHEVDPVVDAFEIAARHVERDRVHRPGGDRHRVEVALELVERDVDADRGVEPEGDAEPLDEADVHLDRLARQAERRDADEHRPAGIRQAVEDRHHEALQGELAGDGQPGRAGADDGDALGACLDGRHDVGDPGGLVPLDEEPLHRPDRERPVDVAAAARPLARCRADVRAHRRDRVRVARQDVALLEPAFGGEVEVAPTVRTDGARFLALDVALEPGGVDRLNEEFLVRVDGQAGVVPFPAARTDGVGPARSVDQAESTIGSRRPARGERPVAIGPRELTASVVAVYPRMRVVRPALPGPRRARDET